MTKLEAAVVEVAAALDELRLPYMLIGGLAVALHGIPRATLDVDVTLWAEDVPEIASAIARWFKPLPSDPAGFVAETRVLPVSTTSGIRADLVFAALPGERDIIRRARQIRINDHTVKIATPEDLILMKLISERTKDREDAVHLLRRFRGTLDRAYLEPRLTELAGALAAPDVLEVYRRYADIPM